MFLYRDKLFDYFHRWSQHNLGALPSSVAWLVTRMISPAFIGCWLLYSDSRCSISDKGPGDAAPARLAAVCGWTDWFPHDYQSTLFHTFSETLAKNHLNKSILTALIWFSNKNPFIDTKSYPVNAWTSLGWPSVTAGECRPSPSGCLLLCQCHNTNIGTQSEQKIGEIVN